MNDKTPIDGFKPVERAFIVLESGHTVTYKIHQKILKHIIKVVEKNIVYKIDKTVYFVMRGNSPA